MMQSLRQKLKTLGVLLAASKDPFDLGIFQSCLEEVDSDVPGLTKTWFFDIYRIARRRSHPGVD